MEQVPERNINRQGSTQINTNTRAALNAWKEQRTPSNSVVRLQLCCDLTIVQGAALFFWHMVAWIANIHSLVLHQLALYGGYFCIQFTVLLFVEHLLDFLDGWNIVRTKATVLSLPKSVLDIIVNVVIRFIVCGAIALLTVFSVFNLRIVELRSFTNSLISISALGNFVLLLHVIGALIDDYIIGNANREDRPASISKGPFGGLMSIVSNFVGKILGYICQGVHLAFHLWPIADSILLSSLVGVIVLVARKALDNAWKTTPQLNRARYVTKESRQLIWPTAVLLMQFCYELVGSIVKISHEYAVRFLVNTYEIAKVKEQTENPKDKVE